MKSVAAPRGKRAPSQRPAVGEPLAMEKYINPIPAVGAPATSRHATPSSNAAAAPATLAIKLTKRECDHDDLSRFRKPAQALAQRSDQSSLARCRLSVHRRDAPAHSCHPCQRRDAEFSSRRERARIPRKERARFLVDER